VVGIKVLFVDQYPIITRPYTSGLVREQIVTVKLDRSSWVELSRGIWLIATV